MRVPVEYPKIQRQHDENKHREATIKPPVVSKWKQAHPRILNEGLNFDYATNPNKSLGKNEHSSSPLASNAPQI
jgi:hypothetical protein